MAYKKEVLREKYDEAVTEIHRLLKILSKHDPDSVSLERYRGYFRKARPKATYRELQAQYQQARKVLKTGQLSVEGHERSIANAIESLHRDGYDFINRKNFNSFMRFLDDARARGLGSLYSSEQLLDSINTAKQKGLSEEEITKNINRWANEMGTDSSGRVIEVENPKALKVRRYGNTRR